MSMRGITPDKIRRSPHHTTLRGKEGFTLFLLQPLQIVMGSKNLLDIDAPVKPGLTRLHILDHGSNGIDALRTT